MIQVWDININLRIQVSSEPAFGLGCEESRYLYNSLIVAKKNYVICSSRASFMVIVLPCVTHPQSILVQVVMPRKSEYPLVTNTAMEIRGVLWDNNLQMDLFHIYINIWLVVSTRLKNSESQLGWLFPIYGKIKNVPNHQSDIGLLEGKRCRLEESKWNP